MIQVDFSERDFFIGKTSFRSGQPGKYVVQIFVISDTYKGLDLVSERALVDSYSDNFITQLPSEAVNTPPVPFLFLDISFSLRIYQDL